MYLKKGKNMELADIKTEKLAEWENIFNSWGWPKDFIYPSPYDWDDLKNYDQNKDIRTKYSESFKYIEWIESIIGEKEFLRWAHLHDFNIKNWQFEIWWFIRGVNSLINKVFPNFYIDVYRPLKWGKFVD